jgi:hypothetical protein
MMTKKSLVLIFFTLLTIAFSATAGETTELSKKAAGLKTGMSREEVITLLGNATWASIPSDKGDYSVPASDFALVLRWKNSPCTPVVVQFDQSYQVKGWDEGRVICGEGTQALEPEKDYSCEKEDRSQFCKK